MISISPSLQKEIDTLSAFSTSASAVTAALLESMDYEARTRSWPFTSVSIDRVLSLSPADRLRLEGTLKALLMKWEKPNGDDKP